MSTNIRPWQARLEDDEKALLATCRYMQDEIDELRAALAESELSPLCRNEVLAKAAMTCLRVGQRHGGLDKQPYLACADAIRQLQTWQETVQAGPLVSENELGELCTALVLEPSTKLQGINIDSVELTNLLNIWWHATESEEILNAKNRLIEHVNAWAAQLMTEQAQKEAAKVSPSAEQVQDAKRYASLFADAGHRLSVAYFGEFSEPAFPTKAEADRAIDAALAAKEISK